MELYGTVKEVNIKTELPKTGGGTYEGWKLVYTDSTGEEKQLFAHSMSLKKTKGLKEALLSLSEGDPFSVTKEKNGQYWEVREIRKGGGPSLAQGAVSNAPAAKWNNPEVQKSIVRQNVLARATEIVVKFSNNPDIDMNIDEVKRIAELLEEWVNRGE